MNMKTIHWNATPHAQVFQIFDRQKVCRGAALTLTALLKNMPPRIKRFYVEVSNEYLAREYGVVRRERVRWVTQAEITETLGKMEWKS